MRISDIHSFKYNRHSFVSIQCGENMSMYAFYVCVSLYDYVNE